MQKRKIAIEGHGFNYKYSWPICKLIEPQLEFQDKSYVAQEYSAQFTYWEIIMWFFPSFSWGPLLPQFWPSVPLTRSLEQLKFIRNWYQMYNELNKLLLLCSLCLLVRPSLKSWMSLQRVRCKKWRRFCRHSSPYWQTYKLFWSNTIWMILLESNGHKNFFITEQASKHKVPWICQMQLVWELNRVSSEQFVHSKH